jgi:hypothetical protein
MFDGDAGTPNVSALTGAEVTVPRASRQAATTLRQMHLTVDVTTNPYGRFNRS